MIRAMTGPTYYDESYPPSLWGGGQPAPKVKVAVASSHPDSAITALLPGQQLAAINAKYEGNPLTAWTAGQFATVAARQVAWTAAAFVDYVAADPEPEPDPEPELVEPEPEPETYTTKAKRRAR